MPVKNLSRLVVYVSHETKAVYQDAAQASGSSVSTMIAEILEQCLPAVKTMAEAQRLIKEDPARALHLIRTAGNTSQMDLINTLQELDNKTSSKRDH